MSPRASLLAAALAAGCARTPDTSAPQTSPHAPDVVLEDSPAAKSLRSTLVDHLRTRRHISDTRVLDAMKRVPRHWFVDAPLEDAYADRPQGIGWGQTISQPTVVAMMTAALELRGDERVLEIGTGSGYQAAVLSGLCREVFTIEIVAPLGEKARSVLSAAGFSNVHVRVGDGYRGWPDAAPFDRVIITAAPPEIPDELVRELAVSGVLVAPVGEQGDQHLERWIKTEHGVTREEMGRVLFVPMVHGP